MLAQPTQMYTHGLVIPLEGGGGPIIFQWNPKTVKEDKSADWSRLNPIGREQPILQYHIGKERVISFAIDVSEPGGTGSEAHSMIQDLVELTKPSVGSGNIQRPPKLRLALGNLITLPCCILSAVSTAYGPLFHYITLGPQQSEVNLTFLEFI